ncbi:TPA: hypothetical protein ACGHB6_002730 [Acinetobacter baumannii]|uniref:hypothetical protein n=1 Tax=Acinetobacter baumannii TaxID=470 RepID=UPI000A37932A|nr:hypothetical protein [Acinetobacter baumannii]EJB5621284.1 hypothetical protein [Acinetobacter baumannii]ELB0340565.1 hypothetical protein [Acinetobacter baumannii]ELN4153576.1 hypothetical protein [Acinetobacter baumannii]ELY0630375.1 hypothetical protein [Acinetobacter baumannii]MDH2611502.1 hypothetical protein [Acinetobacter baumannii]
MNSCFIFPLKIHWLMLFDKFLTGAMLGLGFIVAIWTVIKLTQKPKKERKPHHGVDNSFYAFFLCIIAAILTFLFNSTLFNWVIALFAISMTFVCAITHTEADFCKEKFNAIQEKQNARSSQVPALNRDYSSITGTTFYVGQTVVYVDDFMPDHTETIELIEDGYAYFAKGSRRCILEMIRPATAVETRIGERQE